MSAAEEKRLNVLRNIHDVLEHPTGPRIHQSMTQSLSVHREVEVLLRKRLIERCHRNGEPGFRRTATGDAYLGGGSTQGGGQ